MGKSLKDLMGKYENQGFSKTGWFSLKNDGDTATVRMLHKGQIGTEPDGSPKYDLDVYEVHKMDVDGSGTDRTILCKGDECEICKSGHKAKLRMFLQMLNLDEKNPDKQLQLWERGMVDIKQILGIIEEYGDLDERDIKIKRSGAAGSLKTSYQYFPKDKSERELPERQKLIGSLILDLNREDQIKAIEGCLDLKKGGNKSEDSGSSNDSTRVF